ncbi:MAG: tetratricopeptide repeat protein, partial [Gemmatimonadetes bacterium]|nr:tetratricopeptide repeat protein [Gemmatimonadota bacterium]
MIKQAVLAGGLAVTVTTAAWGQADTAQCDLKTSHFAITRAILYIQNATNIQDTTPAGVTRRTQALDGARRSLLEAIQQGQENSVAAWYYLGLYHYYSGEDALAADSAFDKVEALAPSCAKETMQLREGVWGRVANQGIEGLRNNDQASAKERFMLANVVYDEDPTTFFYLGTIYAGEDNADSALAYFRQSAEKSQGDTSFAEIREKSVQNLARIYEVLEQWDSAAVYFRAYREIRPDDSEALSGLGRALMSSGDTAGAEAVYDEILRKATDAVPLVRRARESMSRGDTVTSQAQSDSARSIIPDPVELFRNGVALFRIDRPAKAAQAFEAGLEWYPYHRNGLFNLGNAYFQLAQNASGDSAKPHALKMLGAVRRLLAIDPASGAAMRLMAAGYQLSGRADSTDIWLTKAGQMSYDVDIQTAQAVERGYYVA